MQGPSARYSLTLTDLGLPQGGAPRGWGSGKNGSVANAAEVLRHVESEAVIRSLGENKTKEAVFIPCWPPQFLAAGESSRSPSKTLAHR